MLGVGQTTVGLHEQQPGVAHFAGYPIHIATQNRRQIGIYYSGVAAPDQLHQRADLVRDRNLGETDFPRQRRRLSFVFRVAVTVQKHDGHNGAFHGGGGSAGQRLGMNRRGFILDVRFLGNPRAFVEKNIINSMK